MVPLLHLDDVHVHFWVRKGLFGTQPVRAVDGVTLSLDAGEVLAVVGESGSGKTTLGRASLGLVAVSRGQVRFEGRSIAAHSEAERRQFRRRAQAIFQDPFASIDPYMTVYDSVAEPLVIHKVGSKDEQRHQVYEALGSVRLTPPAEIGERYPHLLSGGQRQRVGIARALVLQPKFIMADEPVSMVDASSRAELLYLLRELRDRYGLAYLYVTHDIATARHFAQRVVVMYLGRVVESGPVTQIIERPQHPYTRALIAAVPEPDPANHRQERAVLSGEPPSPTKRPSGCAFHPRCPQFMEGKCELASPQLVEVEPAHFVSCFLYESGSVRQTADPSDKTDPRFIKRPSAV